MVYRDKSCQAPYCVKVALSVPCPKCGAWLCVRHMPVHDCEKLEAWQTSSPSLNALKDLNPDSVVVDKEKGKVKVHFDEDERWDPELPLDLERTDRKKPTRKEWKDVVPK